MADTSSATAGARPAAASATFVNPYLGHKSLTETEQELLGEYARLAATIKRITALSHPLSGSSTHAALRNQLRVVERKMGLVLTLFKASVWAIAMDLQDRSEAEAEAEAAAAEAAQYEKQRGGEDETYGPGDDDDETVRHGWSPRDDDQGRQGWEQDRRRY